MERGHVLIVDCQCEGAVGRLSGSCCGGLVSEFVANDTNVRLDLVEGSVESQP